MRGPPTANWCLTAQLCSRTTAYSFCGSLGVPHGPVSPDQDAPTHPDRSQAWDICSSFSRRRRRSLAAPAASMPPRSAKAVAASVWSQGPRVIIRIPYGNAAVSQVLPTSPITTQDTPVSVRQGGANIHAARSVPGKETPSARRIPELSRTFARQPIQVRQVNRFRPRRSGGETGIRTLGGLAPTTVFETAPFDHSGTSPRRVAGADRRLAQRVQAISGGGQSWVVAGECARAGSALRPSRSSRGTE